MLIRLQADSFNGKIGSMFDQLFDLKFDETLEAQRTRTSTVSLGVLIFAIFMILLIAAIVPLFIFGYLMLTFAWWSHKKKVLVRISACVLYVLLNRSV